MFSSPQSKNHGLQLSEDKAIQWQCKLPGSEIKPLGIPSGFTATNSSRSICPNGFQKTV
jgi:hypothetical protein